MGNAHQFWNRVEKSDGCWLWTGTKNEKGYGHLGLGGHTYYAHRVAYILAYDEDPGDQFVCHRCDNPSCVRPDHLFLGEVQSNARDMAEKGRARGGVIRRKLTVEDACVIRKLRRRGMMLHQIAARFGTSVEVVSHIIHGRTYKEITPIRPELPHGPCLLDLHRGAHRFPFKLTLEERFWSKVYKGADCWIWLGSYNLSGYGRFHVERQARGAHRVAYEFTFGPIPPSSFVLHRCDNRACVRPDHLF